MEIGILCVALFLMSLAVLGKFVLRCIANPITVFCGVWATILFAYGLHLYGLYYASFKALTIITIGVCAFVLGAIFSYAVNNRTRKNMVHTSLIDTGEAPQYMILFVLNVISFVFLIGFGLTTIQMLLSGRSFYYIHRIYNQETGTIGVSRLYQNMITWFVWPLMDASISTLAVVIQCDKTKDRFKQYATIMIIVNLMLFTLITGKRAHLGYIAMYFIAVYAMQERKIELNRRTKISIALGLIAIIWSFNFISTSRGSESIFKTLYVYLCGCVPHLSIKLENIFVNPKGITSVYGFYQGPLIIFNSLFHLPYLTSLRSSMSSLIAVTQERVYIGPSIRFNAFITPFYYFYLDGGIVGIIALSFIFGYISMMIYINHIKKRTYKSMVLYLLIFFALYMSMVRIQFFQMRFALSFVYVGIIFWTKKVKFNIKSQSEGHVD